MHSKIVSVSLLALSLLLPSCATSSAASVSSPSTSTSASEVSSVSSSDSFQSLYGEPTITSSVSGVNASYDQATKTWTLPTYTSKITYTLSGYFDGVVNVVSSGNTYKGVKLVLNQAYLVNKDANTSPVVFSPSDKYLQLDSPSNTVNYIVAEGVAVDSKNNLRIGGDGELNVISTTSHALKGDDIRLYGGGKINLSALADGMHGKNFYTNDGESTPSEFTGKCTIAAGESEQALDFCDGDGTANDPWAGSITIDSGASIAVTKAGNVARCNTLFQVDGSLIATGILSDPYISKVDTLKVVVNGTFTVNGTAVPSTNA
jgi:hypothetical protein